MRVDPLADKRSWVSPYNYVQNNPVLRVDPTGTLDWIDNEDGTFTAEDGDSAGSLAKDAGISYSIANTLVESQLGPNYVGADGGLRSNVEIGDVIDVTLFEYNYTWVNSEPVENKLFSPYKASPFFGVSVHQAGFTGIGSGPAGAMFGFGVAWDSKGNVGIYTNIGFAHGADASFGLEYTHSENNSNDPDFSIYTLNGTSVMTNASVWILDAAYGTNTQGNGNYGQERFSTYHSKAFGVSTGVMIGLTRTVEYTHVWE
jgi:hypothetical protein